MNREEFELKMRRSDDRYRRACEKARCPNDFEIAVKNHERETQYLKSFFEKTVLHDIVYVNDWLPYDQLKKQESEDRNGRKNKATGAWQETLKSPRSKRLKEIVRHIKTGQ
jgi:hypothetical protein